MDTDAANRVVAAEARRQKILARGVERLSRITVGTPLQVSTTSNNTSIELAAPAARLEAVNHSVSEHTPPLQIETQPLVEHFVCDTSDESEAGTEEAAAVLASADPILQQVLRGSGDQATPSAASVQAAQRDAEQALHMLLNQLAGSAGVPYLTQRQPPGADGGSGVASSPGRLAGAY